MTMNALFNLSHISIRQLSTSGIPIIVDALPKADWPTPPSLFGQYLSEQKAKIHLILSALAGITL
ncbi:MAG TPA: hypothetical protein VNK03_06585 [Gammaproteobacteria bacterium]|nr:hypothetical protein [Gammaproteobacteria bacterium]